MPVCYLSVNLNTLTLLFLAYVPPCLCQFVSLPCQYTSAKSRARARSNDRLDSYYYCSRVLLLLVQFAGSGRSGHNKDITITSDKCRPEIQKQTPGNTQGHVLSQRTTSHRQENNTTAITTKIDTIHGIPKFVRNRTPSILLKNNQSKLRQHPNMNCMQFERKKKHHVKGKHQKQHGEKEKKENNKNTMK